MTADTTTPLLGLLLQGTGNNPNSWGANLNASVISLLDTIIAGVGTIAVTGGSLTPTATQLLPGTIAFNGTLTADQTIVVPVTQRKWKMLNNCSGNFFMLVKTASGTAVNLPAGKFIEILSDGTGSVYRADANEVGRFFYHAGTTAPPGAIECAGGTPKRASAVDLFAVIGTTWGIGDNITTFTLPNGFSQASGLGCFLRSRTSGVAIGTYQANQNLSHTHAFSGALTAGTLVTDSQGAHTHTANVTDPGHVHSYSGPITSPGAGPSGTVVGSTTATNTASAFTGIGVAIVSGGAHTHTVTGVPGLGTLATVASGATEARPEALTGMLCINY